MKPILMFRHSLAEEEELEAARKYFPVIGRRAELNDGGPAVRDRLVIPRYSALPFNRELCEDIVSLGGEPINTYHQHTYVADIKNWYEDLEGLTPKTWFALDQIPKDGGPFVLKGATNSKKFYWNDLMYADTREDAVRVYVRLGQDAQIGEQSIYVRQYVPLVRLATGLNGLPVSKEFRFFILDGQVVGSGFYWSTHADDLDVVPRPTEVPKRFLRDVIERVGKRIRFWVCDIAQTQAGDWIVIELNDGQQSGLSMTNPDDLYSAMRSVLSP